jgi:hypothetical protein
MTYDPRTQRLTAIKAMIRQNPMIANKNSMLKPLYNEVLRLEDLVADMEAELKSLKAAPKKATAKKKEKTDGDATTE